MSLSLDRFEGSDKQIAVLVTDDGESISLPRALLPAGAKPGAVLSWSLELDAAATAELAAQTKAVQADLSGRDPGGDISL